MQVKVTFLSHD